MAADLPEQPRLFRLAAPRIRRLLCPQCGGAMRIIAFIDQAAVIEKILTHLGLWSAHAHSPAESIAA